MRRLLPILFSLELLAQEGGRPLFDFESGTWAGWTYQGPVDKPTFGQAPFHASKIVPTWRNDRDFTGWQGRYMAVVGDTRHESVSPGRLISDRFEITHRYLRFRYGGEVHPDVRVVLEVAGKEVRTAYGNNSYDMRLRGWDVSEFKGRQARIVLHVGPSVAALMRVDDFHLSDTAPPALGAFDRSEQESDVFRYGELKLLVPAPQGQFYASSSIVRGPGGRWHLYAAQRAIGDRYKDENQKVIVHASAPSLNGPWTLHGPVLEADPKAGENFLWDPFVFVHDNRFYMFYTGSGKAWTGWDKGAGDRWKVKDFGSATQGPHGIHLATSADGVSWTRHSGNPLFSDAIFARHAFVYRHARPTVAAEP
jgi:hypothetical protein